MSMNSSIADFVTKVGQALKIVPKPDSKRIMKFPYTTTQQFGLFPWRMYFTQHWFMRWYLLGFICAFPAINEIHKLANSDANKKKWAEIRAKEAAEEHHH